MKSIAVYFPSCKKHPLSSLALRGGPYAFRLQNEMTAFMTYLFPPTPCSCLTDSSYKSPWLKRTFQIWLLICQLFHVILGHFGGNLSQVGGGQKNEGQRSARAKRGHGALACLELMGKRLSCLAESPKQRGRVQVAQEVVHGKSGGPKWITSKFSHGT